MPETSVSWRNYRTVSEKQRQFLDSLYSRRAANVLFGGAGFGGKSHVLRTAAVELNGRYRELGFPKQYGAIFSSTYQTLSDRQLTKFESELSSLGRIKENTVHKLHFAFHDESMGGICLRNIDDPDKYRGAEFPYVLVEELTECVRDDLGGLLYCRRSSANLPFMPFGAVCNPDGIGHAWVKKLWIDGDFTGDDKEFNPDDFIFIPAFYWENPTYTDGMDSQLFAGLSDGVRRARKEGSWEGVSGARFPSFSRKKHVFNFKEQFPYGLPISWRKYRAVDWGFGAPYCCLWFAVDENKDVWVYREDYEKGLETWEQVERINALTTDSENVEITYLDPAMWGRIGASVGSALIPAHVYRDGGIVVAKANNNREAGWITIENYLGDNEYPNLHISDTCVNLIRTLPALILDNRTPMLALKGEVHPLSEDHAPDALRYGLHSYLSPPVTKVELPSMYATEEERKAHAAHVQRAFSKEITDNAIRSFRKRVR